MTDTQWLYLQDRITRAASNAPKNANDDWFRLEAEKIARDTGYDPKYIPEFAVSIKIRTKDR